MSGRFSGFLRGFPGEEIGESWQGVAGAWGLGVIRFWGPGVQGRARGACLKSSNAITLGLGARGSDGQKSKEVRNGLKFCLAF